MPNYRRMYGGSAYYFTVVTYHRIPILTGDGVRMTWPGKSFTKPGKSSASAIHLQPWQFDCYQITFTRYGRCLNRTIIIPCAGKRSKGSLPKDIWPILGREKAGVYPGKNGEKQRSGRGGFGSMRSAMMMTWAGMSIPSISIRRNTGL